MASSSKNYVYLKPDCGLGSFIGQLDRAFMFCKSHGKTKLLIDLRDSPYSDDPHANVFELFFEPTISRKPSIITDINVIDNIISDFPDLEKNKSPWGKDPKGLMRAEYQISQGKGISQKLIPKETVLRNINLYKDPFFSPVKYIIGRGGVVERPNQTKQKE